MTQTTRRTLRQALDAVPSPERSRLAKDAIASAVEKLPEPDCTCIPEMADELAGQVRRLGQQTALEVLQAIGALWSENGEGPD